MVGMIYAVAVTRRLCPDLCTAKCNAAAGTRPTLGSNSGKVTAAKQTHYISPHVYMHLKEIITFDAIK